MVVIYALLACFIASIWIIYFQLIGIFGKIKIKYVILTFALGAASTLLVFGIDMLVGQDTFNLTGNFANDFMYCFLKIGVVEEFAKAVPLIFMMLFFKQEFDEPIDYLLFACTSALGFSAVENVLYYSNGGANIIMGRAVVSSVGHMLDTALIAYGVILSVYKPTLNRILNISGFFFLAALSHGFYDFWLVLEDVKVVGWLISILYFLLLISAFATILNNALNNSPSFTYKKVVNSTKITNTILACYGFVFAAQFALLMVEESFMKAMVDFRISIYAFGFIIIVAVIRLSRFRLIKGRWQEVRLELPFSVFSNDSFNGNLMQIRVKGDPFNERYVNAFYEEYFSLQPVSSRRTDLPDNQYAYIEQKLFLKNDEPFYVAKLFSGNNLEDYEIRLLKPKTKDTTMMYDKYPIVAILKTDDILNLNNPELTSKDFQFQEWGYLKPTEKTLLNE
jgi:RsiW-degrading membrane proteinase PrsW (M82 family)